MKLVVEELETEQVVGVDRISAASGHPAVAPAAGMDIECKGSSHPVVLTAPVMVAVEAVPKADDLPVERRGLGTPSVLPHLDSSPSLDLLPYREEGEVPYTHMDRIRFPSEAEDRPMVIASHFLARDRWEERAVRRIPCAAVVVDTGIVTCMLKDAVVDRSK